MSQGWIKLHRQLLEWDWYDDINTKVLFLHLLLKANHKEKKYRGKIIKVGQVMTGRKLLSLETGLTEQQIRTSLSKLKSTNEITIESNAKGTIIQVVKYKEYQVPTNEVTNEQPTSNQRVTTNNNDNKEKKEILIDNISSKEFRERTIKFLNKTLGSSFRDSTQQTKKDLKKIWEEKYTLQEVARMIVYKHQEWKDDKDMSKYLVPSTLFRFSNFEKYVEASRNFKPKKEESFYRSASNPQSGQFC